MVVYIAPFIFYPLNRKKCTSEHMQITKLNINHLEAFKVYFNECVTDGVGLYGSTVDDYESFLKKRVSYSEGKGLPDGWAPMSMYLCIKSGIVVGAIRVRHGTNGYIEDVIGHIGYETLPKARGSGVATTMLNWVKDNVIAGDVIVTCEESNFASKRVIEKCGGHYLNCFYSKEDDHQVRRYQLEPSYKQVKQD